MKVVKVLIIAIVFVFCFIFGFLGFNFDSSANAFRDEPPIPKIESPTVSVEKSASQQLYAQNCARCHGADGRGETELGRAFDVPNIADAGWQSKHSDAKIAKKIARGGGGMPAFAKKLSLKETASLVAYVRTLKK